MGDAQYDENSSLFNTHSRSQNKDNTTRKLRNSKSKPNIIMWISLQRAYFPALLSSEEDNIWMCSSVTELRVTLSLILHWKGRKRRRKRTTVAEALEKWAFGHWAGVVNSYCTDLRKKMFSWTLKYRISVWSKNQGILKRTESNCFFKTIWKY